MDFFESTYYRLNKRLLFYLGQWPLQTPNERYFYRTTTVIIFGSLFLAEVIKFINCLGDLYAMIECLPVFGVHFRCLVRFINCTLEATNMRKLTNRIKDDWTEGTGKSYGAILRSYAERGRLLTVFYTVYMFGSLAMLFSIPLTPIILDVVAPLNQSRDRVYLVQTEYFVDQEEKYFYILIHAYVSMPYALAIIVAYDSMYAVYVHHACGIFATVGARLQCIGGIASNNKLQMYKDSIKRTGEAYDDIVACIKMHNNAVEIAKLIESANYICYLFVIVISMLMITTTGFMTVTNLDQPSEALPFLLVGIAELIHLFYVFWQGHLLIVHSEDIFINAYNVNWNDIPPRAQKLLVLIMLRSIQPCKLTAGKIFVMSMENYAAAMKTSMSYFTVLLSMQ